jgi:hypothetical protein
MFSFIVEYKIVPAALGITLVLNAIIVFNYVQRIAIAVNMKKLAKLMVYVSHVEKRIVIGVLIQISVTNASKNILQALRQINARYVI